MTPTRKHPSWYPRLMRSLGGCRLLVHGELEPSSARSWLFPELSFLLANARGLNSRRPRRQQSHGLRAAKPRARRGHGLLWASFLPGGPRRQRGAETAETWTCLPGASHHDADGSALFLRRRVPSKHPIYHRDRTSVSANSDFLPLSKATKHVQSALA